MVVDPGILQPAVPGPCVQQFAGLVCAFLGRHEVTAKDIDPAALQQNTVNVQGLVDLTPMSFGMAEALVGIV